MTTYPMTREMTPSDAFLVVALEELGRKDASAPALLTRDASIDFGRLRLAVQATASLLIDRVPDTGLVALDLPRSPELLVAMLACLWSGRPFLMVQRGDSSAERQASIAAAGALFRLCAPGDPIDIGSPALRFSLADLPDRPADHHALRPCPRHPLSLAYVVFTSGSTGRPKAIAIPRIALSTELEWAADAIGMDALAGSIAALNPAYDGALTPLLLAPLCGRALHVVGDDAFRELAALLVTIKGDWHLDLTPTHITALATETDDGIFPNVGGVLALGGEALTPSRLAAARRLLPAMAIWNLYGPAEAAIDSTAFDLRELDGPIEEVPIGTPTRYTRIVLSDGEAAVTAPGVQGEILIGGPGLAWGYIGQPRETADRFVPDPDGHGARLYRTGDLAYLNVDGRLVFTGRSDDQIKVRGQRVELAEIRQRIAGLAGVADVAVVRAQLDGETRPAAAIRLHPGAELGAIRAAAEAQLPARLMPACWFAVEQLPTSLNGKLDNRALAADLEARFASSRRTSAHAVSADTPNRLAQIWRRLLGHGDFGPHDSFFSVGGDSILMIKLRAALRKEFARDVSMADLVGAPTCAAMAELCGAVEVRATAARPDPAAGGPETWPLSIFQEQMWLAVEQGRRKALPDPYVITTLFEIEGAIDPERLGEALETVLRRHDALLTRFEARGGEIVQRPGAVPWRDVLTVERHGDEASCAERIGQLGAEPLDLREGPPARIAVLKGSQRRLWLFLRVHHLVVDDWSMRIILSEIEQLLRGEALPAPPPAHGYGALSAAARKASPDQHQRELTFWTRTLSNPRPGRVLPVLSGPGRGAEARRISTEIPRDVEQSLLTRATSHGATAVAAAAAVIALAAAAVSETQEIRLASPVAARQDEAAQRLVGYLLNTILFPIKTPPEARLDDVLGAAGDAVRMALANSAIPFPELVTALPMLLDPDAVHARFVYTSRAEQDLRIPGCTVREVPQPRRGAKFDLLISAEHWPGERLVFHFDFDPAVYTADAVDRWARITRLAAAALGDAAGTVAEFQARAAAIAADRLGQLRDQLAARLGGANRRPLVPAPAWTVSQPDWLAGASLAEAAQPRPLLDALPELRADVLRALRRSGALLIRGFGPVSADAFEKAVRMIGGAAVPYLNRSTPRSLVTGSVFTSTEYPPSEHIPLHNENAYTDTWPDLIFFLSQKLAAEGGQTPISDSRLVLEAIPASIRQAFNRRGILYQRCYHRYGLSWEETFQTRERSEVEAYCAAHGIEWEWRNGRDLRTRQRLPATRAHPVTDEAIWFNQAHLFHPSNLGTELQARLLELYGPDDLPRTALYGDGSDIEPEALQAIREAFDRHTVIFDWREGDILVLDNMLWAHGRRPFSGDRRVLVSMTRFPPEWGIQPRQG